MEKLESPRPGGQAYLPLLKNPSFCIHTTEGSTVNGAWYTLNQKGAAPHFIIGENRIVQTRPLNVQGATLRAHNERFIQVECVGHAQLGLHRLTPESWNPLVALTGFVHESIGVPLTRPAAWTDALGPGPWAIDNARRKQGYALTKRGVFGHIDVPDQGPTWHWDPGSLDYTALFAEATKEVADVTGDDLLQGINAFLKGEEPTEEGPARKVWRALTKASQPQPASQSHTHPLVPHTHSLPDKTKGVTM